MLSQTFKLSCDIPVINGVLNLPVLLSGYMELFNGFKGCPPVNNNGEVFWTNIPPFQMPSNSRFNQFPGCDQQFLYDTKTIGYNPIMNITGVGRTWQSWILEGFIQPRKVEKIDLFYLPFHLSNGTDLLGKLGNMYFSKAGQLGRYNSDEIRINDFVNTNTYASYAGEQGPIIGNTGKDTLSISIPIKQILLPQDALYIEFSDYEGFYEELLVTIHYENI